MKKIIISLLASTLLIMSGFSQNYEYTDTKFVQTFDEDEPLDKSGYFSWTKAWGTAPTVTADGLTSAGAFQSQQATGVSFDNGVLDISPYAWVAFEAKASEDDVVIYPHLKSTGDGEFTSDQHSVTLTKEWQTFKKQFAPGTYGGVDITDIRRFEFARFDETVDATLYVKWVAVGDTTQGSTGVPHYELNIEETEGGSVTKDPDATNYEEGTAVTVTATPITGYRFDGWTGDTTASDTSITITMNAEKSITANFTFKASINENALPGLVNVYPNPADDVLYISGLEGNSSAVISDLTGKTVLEIQDDNIDQIDISGLKSGMYMLTCSNDKGILNKIIIKK